MKLKFFISYISLIFLKLFFISLNIYIDQVLSCISYLICWRRQSFFAGVASSRFTHAIDATLCFCSAKAVWKYWESWWCCIGNKPLYRRRFGDSDQQTKVVFFICFFPFLFLVIFLLMQSRPLLEYCKSRRIRILCSTVELRN